MALAQFWCWGWLFFGGDFCARRFVSVLVFQFHRAGFNRADRSNNASLVFLAWRPPCAQHLSKIKNALVNKVFFLSYFLLVLLRQRVQILTRRPSMILLCKLIFTWRLVLI